MWQLKLFLNVRSVSSEDKEKDKMRASFIQGSVSRGEVALTAELNVIGVNICISAVDEQH